MIVIYFEVFEDNLYKKLKEEPSCYKTTITSDTIGEFWLFTNIDIFDKFQKEFNFESINIYSIEEWIDIACEDKSITFLNNVYYYNENKGCALDYINNEGFNEEEYSNWDEVLLNYIKLSIITQITMDLEKSLFDLSEQGFDIDVIKKILNKTKRDDLDVNSTFI